MWGEEMKETGLYCLLKGVIKIFCLFIGILLWQRLEPDAVITFLPAAVLLITHSDSLFHLFGLFPISVRAVNKTGFVFVIMKTTHI